MPHPAITNESPTCTYCLDDSKRLVDVTNKPACFQHGGRHVKTDWIFYTDDDEFLVAEYCPMGVCPIHGLQRVVGEKVYNTGYDTGITDILACGDIDVNGVF